jgi:hypothetical protein
MSFPKDDVSHIGDVSQPETKSGCVIPATMRPKRYLVQKIQNTSLNISNSK